MEIIEISKTQYIIENGVKSGDLAEFVKNATLPGLTLLLASWLSWQDLAKFLLHLGNHGSHGKILIKILLR